jgi:hypothetical protein
LLLPFTTQAGFYLDNEGLDRPDPASKCGVVSTVWQPSTIPWLPLTAHHTLGFQLL